MPIERRSSRTQLTTVVVSVVGLAIVVLLAVMVVRAATDDGQVALDLGDDTFEAGDAEGRAEAIAADGPLLFSDVSGRGQRRPIFLQHLGDDVEVGWFSFDAKAPDSPADCFLEWDADAEEFRSVDGCDDRTFPADGTGLTRYRVEVTEDGDLEVDLREPLDE